MFNMTNILFCHVNLSDIVPDRKSSLQSFLSATSNEVNHLPQSSISNVCHLDATLKDFIHQCFECVLDMRFIQKYHHERSRYCPDDSSFDSRYIAGNSYFYICLASM